MFITDIIYNSIKLNSDEYGIEINKLYNIIQKLGIETKSEDFENNIQSLIVNKYIRAYHPDNKNICFLQKI